MAMPPAAQTPRCRCGEPWEAHQLRCPRPKHQGVGRVIALAVAGGVVLQLLFVVALVFAVGLMRPSTSPAVFRVLLPPAGPVQPRVQACELFYAWEKTHKPSLLDRAVADAYSSRVPWPFAPRFRADLSGLRNSTRKSAHSPAAISFEHAVQDNCKQIKADLTWRHRPAFRRAVAQFSRPSTATGRSAGSSRPGAPG
jgi:hypothetical protein